MLIQFMSFTNFRGCEISSKEIVTDECILFRSIENYKIGGDTWYPEAERIVVGKFWVEKIPIVSNFKLPQNVLSTEGRHTGRIVLKN